MCVCSGVVAARVPALTPNPNPMTPSLTVHPRPPRATAVLFSPPTTPVARDNNDGMTPPPRVITTQGIITLGPAPPSGAPPVHTPAHFLTITRPSFSPLPPLAPTPVNAPPRLHPRRTTPSHALEPAARPRQADRINSWGRDGMNGVAVQQQPKITAAAASPWSVWLGLLNDRHQAKVGASALTAPCRHRQQSSGAPPPPTHRPSAHP